MHETLDLNRAVDVIDTLAPDSRAGLPQRLFYLTTRLTPMINVDLLVGNEKNQKLLTWRDDPFYDPGWHFSGRIVRFKESIRDRIFQVARSELGVRVESDQQSLIIAELMNPDRDIRGHFIFLVFRCKLVDSLSDASMAKSANLASPGEWRCFGSAPANLITPHIRFADLINRTVH